MEKATILIVDDIPTNIDVAKEFLVDDYNIKIATNGIIALKIAQAEPHPDLILLDIMMPGMSGFEVAKELQMRPYTNKIPVIFLTAKTDTDSITLSFETGGVDYVTKPFNPSELQARIKTHLRLKFMREKLEQLAHKLGKYLSPNVYDSIFSGKRDVKIESYRKVLTVCFTDIVGFTSTAESMDHHHLTNWLNNYLNEMANITLKHGGTLDKFMGDAVMVFFGDPVSSRIEIDALKCIEMAQEMIDVAKSLGVEIRVGINTGMCTIGNFGSDDRMDYTIIGREVNLAQRLEVNGESGRILISESTYEMIGDNVKCTPHEHIEMKGIDREIETYLVDE
jgi:class 3 adenylate cyclase